MWGPGRTSSPRQDRTSPIENLGYRNAYGEQGPMSQDLTVSRPLARNSRRLPFDVGRETDEPFHPIIVLKTNVEIIAALEILGYVVEALRDINDTCMTGTEDCSQLS